MLFFLKMRYFFLKISNFVEKTVLTSPVPLTWLSQRERGRQMICKVILFVTPAKADRCKHNGTSWTSLGGLAVALYAAEQKQNSTPPSEQVENFHNSRTDISPIAKI